MKPLDSFQAFYGTRRFITAFTRALHLPLSFAGPLQSIPTIHSLQYPSYYYPSICVLVFVVVSFPLACPPFIFSPTGVNAAPIWVSCHQGKAGPQVADGRDGSQLWRAARLSGLPPSGPPASNLYAFVFSPFVLHALLFSSTTSLPFWLYLAKSTSYEPLHPPVTSSLFGTNILLSTLSLCPSINIRGQIWHPYKTAGKIILNWSNRERDVQSEVKWSEVKWSEVKWSMFACKGKWKQRKTSVGEVGVAGQMR
jgi:hypothetical protein